MDLGQLRYFLKIVEHESFTRAAKDCSVSQPALSQQIAKLEKELGQPLFERQGRRIHTTAAGQILKTQAEKVLQLVDDTKRRITDDGQTGRIRISSIPTIGPYFLSELLGNVGVQFPKANFEINEDVTDLLLKKCSNGEIDVGVLALPAAAKQLTIEPLFQEELLLAVSQNDPLARKPSISAGDLQDEPFVQLGEGHCLLDSIENFCNRQQIQPVSTSRIQQLATVMRLVALGHGISFVPEMAVSECHGVVFRRLAEPPTRTIAMCWNPNRYQSQLLTNFLKGIRELGDSTMEIQPAALKPNRKFSVNAS